MRPAHAHRSAAGLTLIEVMVAVAVFVVAVLGLLSMIVTGTTEDLNNRNKVIAMNAARSKVETMMQSTFSEIFARYNANLGDDPMTELSPGDTFDVTGLQRVTANVPVGSVIFPVAPGGALSEAVIDTAMEMPRDLNNDGDSADANVSATYTLLPVRVRIRWLGPTGPTQLEYNTRIFPR